MWILTSCQHVREGYVLAAQVFGSSANLVAGQELPPSLRSTSPLPSSKYKEVW